MENCKHHNLPKTSRSGYKYCEKCHDDLSKSASILGSIRSEKKAKSSAENGKKGGRPKKKIIYESTSL